MYRGRLAPSPTGYLHLGHARTFWTAQQRAEAEGGTLILRNEDLDRARCRPEFVAAMLEDLRWLGLSWSEGPDVGGPCAPYAQSKRLALYSQRFEELRSAGHIYPCFCSRRDVAQAASAPHGEEEPLYPGTCRPKPGSSPSTLPRAGVSWRFCVPAGRTLEFSDAQLGHQSAVCGTDFGDFLIWRKDDLPAYQLAVVADDIAMQITEVVRGADLATSTFRQLLLYEAFAALPPSFYHCPLMLDSSGTRLAKRHDALSLRTLRNQGYTPEQVRAQWA